MDSLTELPEEFPTDMKTMDDTESVADIPGLALSQSLPPSPHPACPCDNENNTVADPIIPTIAPMNGVDEAVHSDTAEDRQTSSENDVEDKCLNLLNPFSLELDEEISCTKGGECCDHQSPHTNTALAAGATTPTISPTISIFTRSIDNHRNDVYSGVGGCIEDVGVLPNSCLEQAIQHEPIEESFYSTASQKKEKQCTSTRDSDSCSLSQNKDILSLPSQIEGGSGGTPLNDPCGEVEALEELVDLEPGDLEESQQLVGASLTGDQTAPSTHVEPTPRSAL